LLSQSLTGGASTPLGPWRGSPARWRVRQCNDVARSRVAGSASIRLGPGRGSPARRRRRQRADQTARTTPPATRCNDVAPIDARGRLRRGGLDGSQGTGSGRQLVPQRCALGADAMTFEECATTLRCASQNGTDRPLLRRGRQRAHVPAAVETAIPTCSDRRPQKTASQRARRPGLRRRHPAKAEMTDWELTDFAVQIVSSARDWQEANVLD
jgi:hypothetical protein